MVAVPSAPLLREEPPNTRGLYGFLRLFGMIGVAFMLLGIWSTMNRAVPVYVLAPALLMVLIPLWLQYRVPLQVRYRLYEDELELVPAVGDHVRIPLDDLLRFQALDAGTDLAAVLPEHDPGEEMHIPNVPGAGKQDGWWVIVWQDGRQQRAAVVRPSRRLAAMIEERLDGDDTAADTSP